MSRQALFAIFILVIAGLRLQAQITNTGLPIGITEGAIVSAGNINSEVRINNNGTLNLRGDLRTIGYTGSGTLKLTGTDQSLDFGQLQAEVATLLMEAGGTATFNNPLFINTALNLNSGSIFLPSNNMALGQVATLSGGSAASYIKGKLVRAGNGSMLFPVGNEELYTPVTLDLQGNLAAVGVELEEENPAGVAGKGALAVSAQRYWTLTDEDGNFSGAIVEAPILNETVAPALEEAVVVGNQSGDIFRSYGGGNFRGSLASGAVSSTEPVPAGRFAIGRFFDEQLRINDSLALVQLYEELEGTAWNQQGGWGDALLDDWFGVTIEQKRVAGLDLSSNNLVGSISDQSLPQLSELTSFDLSQNQIQSLASLNNLTRLTDNSGDVSSNALTFASLENQANIDNLIYSPQATVLEEADVVVELGETGALDRQSPGINNQYAWFTAEDDLPFEGGADGILSIPDATVDDENVFYARITNPRAPELTLTTTPIAFYVSSLQRDRRALLALYNATNGPFWANPTGAPITGWDENTDISQWSGVNLNSSGLRVESVLLEDFGLVGEVPSQLRAMTFVNNFDFGSNELTTLPVLREMPNLTTLDVTDNRLDFASIQQNLDGIENFTFSPQRPLLLADEIRVPQGTDYTFDFPVAGENLTYTWRFQDQIVSAGTSSSFTVDSVSFGDMGDYSLEITDELVAASSPGFALSIEPQTLLATADIRGNIENIVGAPVDEGEIVLYRVAEEPFQPYDSIGTIELSSDSYVLDDVVLGDYIYLFLGNLEQYAPTYFESSATWSAADEVILRKDTTNFILVAQTAPVPFIPGPDNDNTIRGYLEIDPDVFPPGTFSESGRTLARRRVRKAGVSFNRARFVNRGEDVEYELVAYVLTDDNGEFEVPNLPDGQYVVSFEYPGIPMDETSFVEFELGPDGIDENEITLAADITPQGIVVEKVEETGIYTRYFKDLNVFPVPASRELNITYAHLNADDIIMQLIDLSGSVKLEQEVPKGSAHHLKLDVSGLDAGIYLVTFVDREKGVRSITSRKLIVRR